MTKLYKRPGKWSHDTELRELYWSTSNTQLAQLFGVSRKTIYRHARRLGLPVKSFGGNCYGVQLTSEWVTAQVRNGVSLSQLSRDTGRSRVYLRDMVGC